MAKFMLLIHGDAAQWEAMTAEEWVAHDAAHAAFRAAAGSRVVGGEQLEPAPTATTVRGGVAGEPVITDGPFLDTKEGLGGFYLLEAGDLDEVIKLVSLLPEVRAAHSAVEIRPVVFHG
ncbi:YciI family protein [Actinoplanes sp. CA-252034]|uniref:YciI family protein n=1 Tax=Actinoplanes sp. CA-252034 TaxID=3239906 RepID=UPI003D984F2B